MIQTLVTGGAGFVGSAIVKKLALGRESVRVLTRHPESIDPRRRTAGTEFFMGDIFDARALREAMKGCNGLVIATQFENAPFENPRKGMTYEHVDGEGTELQVSAAKETGVERIIYISGAGTREGRSEPWFHAKARAEKSVRESGLKWTILRPSWIYGPTDRSLNRFASWARLFPIVPIAGAGRQKVQPVFINDVGEIVRLVLNNPRTHGMVFEIGGPQLLTMKEIVKTLLRVMRKRRIVIPIPKPLVKMAAAVLQYLPERPITSGGVDFVTMEEVVDNRELLETLDARLTPLEDGLRTYLVSKSGLSEDILRRHAA
ncbi:MAG: NAD(P)H-binding protein [Pseudomonadota bacterium]